MKTQYFRITMLRSWQHTLATMLLPVTYRRVTTSAGPTLCFLIVAVPGERHTTEDVEERMRAELDDYPGQMKVEDVTQQEGERITQAAEDAAYINSLKEPKQ